MNRFDRHPVASGLLVASMLLGLGLVGTELTLAWLNDNPTVQSRFVTYDRQIRLREWRPNTWWEYAPPKARIDNPGEIVRSSYRIETDADGYIKPGRVYPDPDVTIVFLGGSTTESMYVDGENRFPYLTGRILERQTGLKINSLNGGKSGNNVTHINDAFAAKVVRMKPDYAVLMEAVNDMALLEREGTYWAERDTTFSHLLEHKLSLESIAVDLRNLLIPRTYEAFRIARQTIGSRLGRVTFASDAQAATIPDRAPLSSADNLAAYRAAVTQFVSTAKAWGITPVLMTQLMQDESGAEGTLQDGHYLDPARLAERGMTAQSAKQKHAQYNAVMRSVADTEQVLLIDLVAMMPADTSTVYDGLHFHDTGSRQVAAIIADHLSSVVKEQGKRRHDGQDSRIPR